MARVGFTAHAMDTVGPIDLESLLQSPAVDVTKGSGDFDGERIVNEHLTDAITSIRENIIIRRVENVLAPAGASIGSYVHGKVSSVYERIQMGTAASVVIASHEQKSAGIVSSSSH